MTHADRKWAAQRAVHACRRRVAGLEDEATWRAFLDHVTGGQTSVRSMTMAELGRVIDALHARGAPASRPRLDEPQLRMARGLWITLHQAGAVRNGSDAALDAFVRRVTGVGQLTWCGPDQANKVIEALKDWCRRKGLAPQPAADPPR